MRTKESSAVFGSPLTFSVAGRLLFFIIRVTFSAKASASVPLLREQRFSGCSLKICTQRFHIIKRCPRKHNVITFLRRIKRYRNHSFFEMRLARSKMPFKSVP